LDGARIFDFALENAIAFILARILEGLKKAVRLPNLKKRVFLNESVAHNLKKRNRRSSAHFNMVINKIHNEKQGTFPAMSLCLAEPYRTYKEFPSRVCQE
jgi:hypothetical protein